MGRNVAVKISQNMTPGMQDKENPETSKRTGKRCVSRGTTKKEQK
jgi:hypothetical protein